MRLSATFGNPCWTSNLLILSRSALAPCFERNLRCVGRLHKRSKQSFYLVELYAAPWSPSDV